MMLAASLASCGRDSPVQIPRLEPLDLSAIALPVTAAGNSILIQVENSRLEIDPTVRDPITAVATCADLVTLCYAPPTRSLDVCIAAIPTCSGERPWEETVPCCPSRCRDDYQRARRDGVQPRQAYDQIYLTAPTCFPGVAASIAGAP